MHVWGALVDAEWFLRRMVGLLAHEDAWSLTLVAVALDLQTLYQALVLDASSLRPISSSDLVNRAVECGMWRVARPLQLTARRSRYALHRSQLTERDVVGRTQDPACVEWMWVQSRYPVEFSPSVLYDAIKRGQFNCVVWLHSCVEYNVDEAVQLAAKSHNFEMVQWLLDHHESVGRDEEKKQWLSTILRLEDSSLNAICWCNDRHHTVYCLLNGYGLLPARSGMFPGSRYPLMDWAAEQGNVSLLHQLHHDAFGTRTCTQKILELAAAQGHFEVVRWLLRHRRQYCQVVAPAIRAAASNGHLPVIQYLLKKLPAPPSLSSAMAEAAERGQLETLEWLYSRCGMDDMHRPRSLSDFAVGSGSIKMLEYVHTVAKRKFSWYAAQSSAEYGHYDATRWLIDLDSELFIPTEESKRRLLGIAASGGNLDLVQWCIDELGAWDPNILWSVADKGQIPVLQFLLRKAEERAASRHTRVEDELRSNSVNAVSLLLSGVDESTVEWVLLNTPETEPLIREGQARGFVSHTRPTSPYEVSWNLLWTFLHCRPRFVCCISIFPVWTVQYGGFRDLKALETLGHPQMFTTLTLRAILKYSRDEAIMAWFLERCNSSLIDMAVVGWIAKYGVTKLLPMVHDVFFGSNQSSKSKTGRKEVSLIKFLGTVAWAAVSHDQVYVLEWIERQSFPESVLKRLWSSRISDMAARRGSLRCLTWLVRTDKLASSQLSGLTGITAQHGQLRCLRGLYQAFGFKCSTYDLLIALRRGHMDTAKFILQRQPALGQSHPEHASEINHLLRTYQRFCIRFLDVKS